MYDISDYCENPCGYHLEKLNRELSEGRESTDIDRVKIKNRKKLCELRNMYRTAVN